MKDFDTSGAVLLPSEHYVDEKRAIRWPDLSPFVQGYVEAMFRSQEHPWGERRLPMFYQPSHPDGPGVRREAHFSDLAPETLARIMEDCGDRPSAFAPGHDRVCGQLYWADRQRGQYAAAGFPPITVYLGDDGKVYLK